MADIVGLRLLGFILGGITAAVTLVAFLLVRANVEGSPEDAETLYFGVKLSDQSLVSRPQSAPCIDQVRLVAHPRSASADKVIAQQD